MASKPGGTKRTRATNQEVASLKHHEKRTNIPTEELRDFVAEDEAAPKSIRYPRDASLDPQLVWKGKDEQDGSDLIAPVVPIYIQEKIHPQTLVNDLLANNLQEENQLNLFSDFNGGPKEFEQKIDFYHHEQNWSNRLILGDSFLVMNSLSEKEGLKGKVQTIFVDPPYGIRFGSNWQVSTRKKDVKDNRAEDLTRQPEQIRAFRDTWELGIHSYLTYLRDRLTVSRELLTESGSIFVQIGDENIHIVRSIMDEVFGSENFMGLITFRTTAPLGEKFLPGISNFLIWYSKSRENCKYRQIWQQKSSGTGSNYSWVELADGLRRKINEDEDFDGDGNLKAGRRMFYPSDFASSGFTESCTFDFEIDGRKISAGAKSWRTTRDGVEKLKAAKRLQLNSTGRPVYIAYFEDWPMQPINNMWVDTRSPLNKDYVVQTDTKVIERCILMTSDPGDLVLDPTCGSGTTAVVAEQWGRRWITCDTSRVSLALARTRIMSTRFPAYILTDTLEGKNKEEELLGVRLEKSNLQGDVRKGFVYKRVPHITLKSISNNPEINSEMNAKEIDAAIAKSSDFEMLIDQPYEVPNRVRVCGPFSVESLSPHRVLSNSDTDMDGSISEKEAREQQDFVSMVLDNLKRSGIQNTVKNERLNLTQLEPFAGKWISARGTYSEADGTLRTIAVSIGPEHGTVGPLQVKEAAKEAVQGVGFDVLVICGFAFDPHVSEEVKRYGKLTVLATKMNPDLAMGDDLLKKTGAGNLFMVFGEPDVEIKINKTGDVVVELKGLDIYDPTTGQVRSSSTDDVACWFIDTEYNEESFFVRHAYFTGADKPMDKLKKAMKSEIDEEAWSSLYGTVSRTFSKPKTQKIAVKVINHYGDEVLKVFDVK